MKFPGEYMELVRVVERAFNIGEREKRDKITLRIFDKASSIHISLNLPTIIYILHISIYTYVCVYTK